MKTKIRPMLFVVSLLVLSMLACQFAISPFSNDTSGQPLGEATAETIQVSQDLISEQRALISLYQVASPGVVSISVSTNTGGAQGSGFVYDSQGHIVTNYHVVQGQNYIEVAFPSGLKTVAEVIGEDPDSDLAVIKVDVPASELHPQVLGDSDSLQVGQYVVAIGNPFGLHGSMSTGIVSSLGRSLESMNEAGGGSFFSAGDLIQTDAAINPGNSGGPLLNLNGEVIGVNRAIRTYTSSGEGDPLNSGVGFAVSSNMVRRVVPILIEEGHIDYPYLGISSRSDLSLAEAQDLGLDRTDGALITAVAEGGPAEDAGLEPGDLIVSIDGQPLMTFDEMIAYLFKFRGPGDTVELGVVRDGEELSIDLVLGARP
jgi:S1-C subfamily serine protease